MWTQGYFACSTDNVTDKAIKSYIKKRGEQDNDFYAE